VSISTSDGIIKLWNLHTGACLKTLKYDITLRIWESFSIKHGYILFFDAIDDIKIISLKHSLQNQSTLSLEFAKTFHFTANYFSNIFEDTMVTYTINEHHLTLYDLLTNSAIEKYENFDCLDNDTSIITVNITTSKDAIMAYQFDYGRFVCHVWDKKFPLKAIILNFSLIDFLGRIARLKIFGQFIIFTGLYFNGIRYIKIIRIYDICKKTLMKEYEGLDWLILKDQFLIIWNPSNELERPDMIHIWDLVNCCHVDTIVVSEHRENAPHSYYLLGVYWDEEDSLIVNTDVSSFSFSVTKKHNKFHFF
jgi:hypothetical protein